MIKFTASTASGKTLVGLGLSKENIKRLRKGKPIKIDDFIPGHEIMIFYGDTEERMAADLLPLFGADTTIVNAK